MSFYFLFSLRPFGTLVSNWTFVSDRSLIANRTFVSHWSFLSNRTLVSYFAFKVWNATHELLLMVI